MATPSAEINSDNSAGTSLEQFRSALTRQVARRNMGLELSDEHAQAIAADRLLSASWYKLWRISMRHSSPTGGGVEDTPLATVRPVVRGAAILQAEVQPRSEHSGERHPALPPAVLPHADVSMTVQQFRTALRRSAAARRHIGLDISDDDAAMIAAHEELTAAWFRLWSTNARTSRVLHEEPRVINEEHGAEPAARGDTGGLIDDWQRQLPVRFNPPPDWPDPGRDWILQHIGLEMSDEWRPAGAPTDDPPGWLWWIPQEPAWSTWINSRNGAALMLRPAGTVFGVFAGLTLALSLAGWSLWVVIAGVCAFGSGVGFLLTAARDRHFRRDPLGDLRDNHLQVAERLKIGAPVGDGHSIAMADFSDIGDWFDGE